MKCKSFLFTAGVLLLIGFSSHSEAWQYRLGALLPLTGRADYIGQPQKNTIDLLVKGVNRSGGIGKREIKLFIRDTECNPSAAVNQLRRLIEVDRVHAVIGPSLSSEIHAVLPLFNEYKIPAIICSPYPEFGKSYRPWIFQSAPRQSLRVDRAFEHMKQVGINRLHLYGPVWNEPLESYIKGQAREYDISVVGKAFIDSGTREQAVILERYPGDRGDPQSAVLFYGHIPRFQRERWNSFLRKRRDALYVLEPNISVLNRSPKFPGKGNTRVVMPAYLFPSRLLQDEPIQGEKIAAFATHYRKAFQEDLRAYNFWVHDAFKLIVNAIESAHGAGDRKMPEEIRSGLEETKGFVGLAGTFNFSKKDHNGLDKRIFHVAAVKDNGCPDDLEPCNNSDDCGEDPTKCQLYRGLGRLVLIKE